MLSCKLTISLGPLRKRGKIDFVVATIEKDNENDFRVLLKVLEAVWDFQRSNNNKLILVSI